MVSKSNGPAAIKETLSGGVDSLSEDWATKYSEAANSPRVHGYGRNEDPRRPSFQRDRDRLLVCDRFRELGEKTQVFSPSYRHHYRRRLSHTVEVWQLSRTLATHLGLNPDLVEAIAFGHDFGHTPFGHAGEAALNACLEAVAKTELINSLRSRSSGVTAGSDPAGVLELIEHLENTEKATTIEYLEHADTAELTERLEESGLQAVTRFLSGSGFHHASNGLRYVEIVAADYLERGPHSGLDLTAHVREGILKHSGTYHIDWDLGPHSRLWRRLPASLEGQAVEMADLIASLVADLTDAYDENLFTLRTKREDDFWKLGIRRQFKELRAPTGEITHFYQLRSPLVYALMKNAIDTAQAILRDYSVKSSQEAREVGERALAQEEYLNGWRSANIIRFSDDFFPYVEELWRFRDDNVWTSPQVIRMNVKGSTIVKDLWHYLWEHPGALQYQRLGYPEGFLARFQREKMGTVSFSDVGAETIEPMEDSRFEYRDVFHDGAYESFTYAQLLTDYISTLTDDEAIQEHNRLFSPAARVL